MRKPMIAAVLALATVMGAGSLSAQSALKDETRVTEGLIAVGMAYEISERCNDLSARLFRGLGYLNSLKNEARDLGYSNAQIDAYVDDRDEQNRLEDIALGRLADLGVIQGDGASYCTVGRAQMDANTRVGWLLR